MGIPVNMFTVIFAVGRSIGWMAQWCEMAGEPVVGRCRFTVSVH